MPPKQLGFIRLWIKCSNEMTDDYRKGLLVTIAGVLVICPDTLLLRMIDADQWPAFMSASAGIVQLTQSVRASLLPPANSPRVDASMQS